MLLVVMEGSVSFIRRGGILRMVGVMNRQRRVIMGIVTTTLPLALLHK